MRRKSSASRNTTQVRWFCRQATTGVWSEHGFTFTKKDAHTYVITDKE